MRGCARRAAEGGGETVGNKWRCPWCATALLSAVLLLLATPPGASGAGLPARIPARDGAGPRAGHGGFTASLLGHMRASVSCTRGGAAVLGAEGLAEVLRPPPYLRGDGCGAGRQRSAEKSTGLGSARVAAPWALRGAGEENAEHSEDGNQTKAVCNTDGGCPHGRHSDNPDEQHCMECEVMAFLQRAANLLQQAGGRIESTIFAEQWTELYPEDPLTPEQVATAVAGILKESGYFHVEETSDPAVKLFELIEQADDGGGIGDCPQTICLPFELSPPEQDDFLDAARDWLATTGVGRHPAVGSGALTHEELAELIAQGEDVKGDEKPRRRHDEAQYTGKWGEQLVGYWTLGACDGSNGCLHKGKKVGMQHHWTCCGSADMNTVFCEEEGEEDEGSGCIPCPRPAIPELP